MSAVVLRNFAKNFGSKQFPMKGLKLLSDILQKEDEDGRTQQMLLVHMTKANISVGKSVYLYTEIAKMVLRTNLSDRSETWRILALRTMEHPQVSQKSFRAGLVRIFHSFTVKCVGNLLGINKFFFVDYKIGRQPY